MNVLHSRPWGAVRILWTILGLGIAASSLPAAEPDAWTKRLAARIADHAGEAAVVVRHLESGAEFKHRETEPFPTASLIKLPIMVEAYRQAAADRIKLTDSVTLRAEDKVPGSGILTPHFSPGASFSVRDSIRLMIAWSDNTATNLVVDQIGLPSTTRAMLDLGYPQTRLNSKVFRRDTSLDPNRSREFGLGSTTAAEITGLLERIHRRELVSPQACDEMLEHLATCQDKATFPKHLPTVAKVAHKTGLVSGIRTDAGLVTGPGGTLVLAVLTKGNRKPEGQSDEPGEQLCADIARLAFDHFNPPEMLATEAQRQRDAATLKIGASGPAVMDLQRALNGALKSTPPLDVDGEFGPQTQAAVKRFQQSQNLEPTGVVDLATRKALDR